MALDQIMLLCTMWLAHIVIRWESIAESIDHSSQTPMIFQILTGSLKALNDY